MIYFVPFPEESAEIFVYLVGDVVIVVLGGLGVEPPTFNVNVFVVLPPTSCVESAKHLFVV